MTLLFESIVTLAAVIYIYNQWREWRIRRAEKKAVDAVKKRIVSTAP